MGVCVILPVGVTKETVEKVVSGKGIEHFDCVIAVTVPGFEDIKKSILEGIRYLSDIIGARVYEITVQPDDGKASSRIYHILLRERPSKVILVGTTGSRYLYPILLMSALYYWRETNAQIYLLHGIEGDEGKLAPLQGFFAPVMRISSVQRRVLDIVYGTANSVSGKELIEKHGFTKSVYAVLADLERKGLVRVGRNKVERTFPGELFYHLLRGDKT